MRSSIRSIVCGLAASALALSAALGADYKIKPLKVLPVESHPARTTVGQVTVAVDPYATDERSFTVFDVKDLNSRGYFPLLVVVHNGTANPLALRTRDIVLVTEGGQVIYSHPATLVVADGIKGGTSTKSGSPLLDFTSKELSSSSMEPGSAVHGFLFFFSAEPKKNLFAGSTLRIPKIVDEITRQPIGPFLVPLAPALENQDTKPRK